MILQAVEENRRLEQEHLHLQELGISTLSALYVNSQSDPKKSQRATPRDFQYFAAAEIDVEVPSTIADSFFSLITDEVLPGWALAIVPLPSLRKAKRGLPVSRPRALVGDGVLLLLPQVAGEAILCGMAVLDGGGVSNVVSVHDIDNPETTFLITLPDGERQWILNAELNLSAKAEEAYTQPRV